MKGIYSVLFLMMLSVISAQAAEEPAKPAPSAPPAVQQRETPPPPASEAAQKWKALKAQEEWVTRLRKQIQGETNQLDEMRTALAQAFKLEPAKLEAGLYEFDEKSGVFVEKKAAA